jgi:hypothetical protein
VLLEPGGWVGGMMSGGLSNTDTGQRGAEVISRLAGEFFRRARAIEETRGACLDPCASTFFFEPQVAEQVFEAMPVERTCRQIALLDMLHRVQLQLVTYETDRTTGTPQARAQRARTPGDAGRVEFRAVLRRSRPPGGVSPA